MARVLRSALKNSQIKEDLTSKLSVCKKSKVIKRNTKKKLVDKSEGSQQNNIWSISSIISNIFEYTDFKDLVEFNTVCKRWSHLTNPIIHKTIKLQRKRAIQNKIHDKRFNKAAKTDAEVEIRNYYEPRSVYKHDNSINSAPGVSFKAVGIKKIIKGKFITEAAVLPQSLTKLAIQNIYLYKNPELFVQTINSHTSLSEYKFNLYCGSSFIDPFFKRYSTLKTFEYNCGQLDQSQSLIKVFKSNPQLETLKLWLSCCNDELMTSISRHLVNLEEFYFIELYAYRRDKTSIISKFSQPTKIKKLNLAWDRLSICSLNSILLNCPYLEELCLDNFSKLQDLDSDISICLSKSSNIKKLNLKYGNLNVSLLNSVLMNCRRLKVLDIQLPREWKECIKVIGSTCIELEKLAIWPSNKIYGQERNTFYQELYEIEFLSSNSLYKSTLKHPILNQFNFYDSKAEYFKNFQKLKYIEYPYQIYPNRSISNQEIEYNKDLWPNYNLVQKNYKYNFNAKMVNSLT
ncbi:hypothetical protein CONCODRAFT_11208 [Conidiobolus coronatus NRRL 28638]|uniref:F-box domain-containing protein n=1 Tax=Conidiobolus coronatus (strain ATCC 28846 / CBS 209.66 / NRRL 28638) TaxID=796925 RepID=A0A137NVL2_CONC2|nr:hypothetical protein CONCODRAFT_11208 [Conidiobolus coronatus NRRL 28638]|eukprot:KXN66860.1 hypothetical protein CONCODRAFT_11208 [Conidiobolus coronatus NRRL 28638]